jgi:LacI family transcriptional regulator
MKKVKPARITMQDVAREAGVSQSTVSFVLNGNKDVRIAEDTQSRVLEAAARLGYRHRLGERPRARNQGPFIGFMIDEIATSIFASISIEGAREMAWSSNHVLDIAMTGGDRDYEEIVLKRWMDDGAAGIIYASILTRHITPPKILDSANTVLLNCHDDNKRFAAVVPSEKLGGYTATEALIEAGYERIAHITGEQWMEAANERLEGYRNALISNARPVDPALIVAGNFLPIGGYEAANKLMDLPDPPDAIFCANDLTAVGAYQALAERGLKIPKDVAIIGYDDQEIARHMHPPLSTILLPHREMGEWAVEYLLTTRSQESRRARVFRLECPLVRRSSF